MIRRIPAIALTALALAVAPVAGAAAAPSVHPGTAPGTAPGTSKPLPNPCKTFTSRSAHTLLRVSAHTRLAEKLTSSAHPVRSRTCTIRHHGTRLEVVVQRQAGGTGSGERCYARHHLGPDGMICVSAEPSVHFTVLTFRKHGIWVADGLNVTLPDKGKRLYEFALPQYRHFAG